MFYLKNVYGETISKGYESFSEAEKEMRQNRRHNRNYGDYRRDYCYGIDGEGDLDS